MNRNLFNARLEGLSNTIFFDVCQNDNGKQWLKITQSKKSKDGTQQYEAIFIFDNQLDQFKNLLRQAETILKEIGGIHEGRCDYETART